jgi:hypothetical protein
MRQRPAQLRRHQTNLNRRDAEARRRKCGEDFPIQTGLGQNRPASPFFLLCVSAVKNLAGRQAIKQ